MAESQARAALAQVTRYRQQHSKRPWPESDPWIHVLEGLPTLDHAASDALNGDKAIKGAVFRDGSILLRSPDGRWRCPPEGAAC
jgi:hypothetical protein